MPKKPKQGDESSDERKATSTARLPVELLRQARTVAAHRGIDLGEYLIQLLTGQVQADYERIIRPDAKR